MEPTPHSLLDAIGFRDRRDPKPITRHNYAQRWQTRQAEKARRESSKDPGALLRCAHCHTWCEPGKCPTGLDKND